MSVQELYRIVSQDIQGINSNLNILTFITSPQSKEGMRSALLRMNGMMEHYEQKAFFWKDKMRKSLYDEIILMSLVRLYGLCLHAGL